MLRKGFRIRLGSVLPQDNDSGPKFSLPGRDLKSSFVRSNAVDHQRKRWTRLAGNWEAGGATGLSKVVESVLSKIKADPNAIAVDLGTGTGQLAIPIAPLVREVWAVDISKSMLDLLVDNAAAKGISNIKPIVSPIETLDFPPASVDLVVTNYVLHHLLDSDKQATIAHIYQWLKPGGYLVIGDMMFGRGSDSRDRQIIASKLFTMAKKGPTGWWRILKNVWRFSARLQERPVRIDVWEKYLESAGFKDISYEPVIAEAVVMVARSPK